MRKVLFFLIISVFGLIALPAQDNPLLWRGSIETDQRLLLEKENDWAWNENRLDLQLEKRVRPVRIVGNVWLRHLGPSITESSADLFYKDKINPWNLDVREAYVEVYGFISDKLDLKAGRQQFAWGTADRFNPTDNLNPPDLEDIFDFGRVSGSDAVSLQWHFSHSTSLQGVFMPFFRPANMPLGIYADLMTIPLDLPPGFSMRHYNDTLQMPRNNLNEGVTAGARLRSFVLNTDFSVSYIYGRDPLPVPDLARLSLTDSPGKLDVAARLIYPRHHIIGADMSGSIGRVGIWAEAALFIPEEEIVMKIHTPPADDLPLPLPPVIKQTMLKKKAYTKFILGADYTFRNQTYLNIQYLHGFLHESGDGNLNDYLFVQTERNFLQNTLRVQPLAGGLSIADRDEPDKNYALFYTPEVSYIGIDNLEVTVGGYFFTGKGDNLFAGLKERNMIRLAVKGSF